MAKLSEENKTKMLAEVKAGASVLSTAHKYGISHNAVRYWIQKSGKVKRTYTRRAKPEVITVQYPEDKHPMVILMGDSREIGAALQRLYEIRRGAQ